MKLVILSLRVVNDKSVLSYDLTGKLTDFENHHNAYLEIKLPTGVIYLKKWEYVNTLKIYQDAKDAKCFFIIFQYKKVNEKACFEHLMKYAIDKVTKSMKELSGRVKTLKGIHEKLKQEMAA